MGEAARSRVACLAGPEWQARSLLHCRAACRGNNTSLLLPLSLSRTHSLRCLKVQVLYLTLLTALTVVLGGSVLRKSVMLLTVLVLHVTDSKDSEITRQDHCILGTLVTHTTVKMIMCSYTCDCHQPTKVFAKS